MARYSDLMLVIFENIYVIHKWDPNRVDMRVMVKNEILESKPGTPVAVYSHVKRSLSSSGDAAEVFLTVATMEVHVLTNADT